MIVGIKFNRKEAKGEEKILKNVQKEIDKAKGEGGD